MTISRKSHLPSKWMEPPKNDLETPLSSQQHQLPEVGGCTPPACQVNPGTVTAPVHTWALTSFCRKPISALTQCLPGPEEQHWRQVKTPAPRGGRLSPPRTRCGSSGPRMPSRPSPGTQGARHCCSAKHR